MSLDRASEETILEALSKIRDPETGAPVTKLAQIESVEVREDGSVKVSFHPVSPYTPVILIAKLALDIATALRCMQAVNTLEVTISGHALSDYLNRSLGKVLMGQETD